ncbi:MAG TPA: hypothetical protein VGJ16_08475 [Pirellulales bacterium]
MKTPIVLCHALAVAFSALFVPFFMLCHGEGEVFVDLAAQALLGGAGLAAAVAELDQGIFGALHVDGCKIEVSPAAAVVAGLA